MALTFERTLSKKKLEREVRNNWNAWRLVMAQRGFDYQTVFYFMTPQEIDEANIALDLQIEAEKKALKKKG